MARRAVTRDITASKEPGESPGTTTGVKAADAADLVDVASGVAMTASLRIFGTGGAVARWSGSWLVRGHRALDEERASTFWPGRRPASRNATPVTANPMANLTCP